MQYSNSNIEGYRRTSAPQGSPWRGSQGPPTEPQLRNQATQPGFSAGQGLKIPNLPKLGSNGQSSSQLSQTNSRFLQQQQTPSFAQAVQKAHTSTTSGISQGKARPPRQVSAKQPSSNESGSQILGSVNAQMMPRVITSYGMSGLNTVLPGASSNQSSSRTSYDTKPHSSVSNTPKVQNLNISDSPAGSTTNSAASGVKAVDSEKYGLKSLLGIMDASNKEKQSVVLGSDLSQSGLNLGSTTEKLSHTFASPWQETSKHSVIPEFTLPECYSINTVVPQQQKLQNFDEGALFYIFYTMPRDAMQEAAAVELTNRSWRYHKELKMWLTKDPFSEPIQTNNQEESGTYIFFDPITWKKIKREYILYYPDIA